MRKISDSSPADDLRPASAQLHGVLVRVYETGVLLMGESATGKSGCALELVANGHQLVADDTIDIIRLGDRLVGSAPELTRDLLEVRGLGIIDIRALFGASAVSPESDIDLCIEIRERSNEERLADVIHEEWISGRLVPKFIFGIGSGRSLTTLITTAVRMYRSRGSFNTMSALIKDHAALVGSDTRLA